MLQIAIGTAARQAARQNFTGPCKPDLWVARGRHPDPLVERKIPELHDQFLISHQPCPHVPAAWSELPLDTGNWTLAHHPNLPVTRVQKAGRTLGWLLGWAIDKQLGLLRQPVVEAEVDPERPPETWVYGLTGRYAVLLLEPGPRFYLDPCGTLGAVFDEKRPLLASTATAMCGGELSPRPPVLEPNQFYPAGTTAFAGIRRLLPNHYLDMESWRVVRHWPTEPFPRVPEQGTTDIEGLVDRIVSRLSYTINSVSLASPTYLPLTAGRDSRMLTACARQAKRRVVFVTFKYDDDARLPDMHVARQIARRFQLNHVGIPLVEPTAADRDVYLARTGFAGHWGKSRDFDLACRRSLDLNRAWLTGFGGEIGRAFYWRDSDVGDSRPSPEQLIERLNLPRDHATLQAWSAWQRAVPHRDVFELLDLTYIEQRMGCWAGPHMYGAAPFRVNLTPFADRQLIEALMSLPIQFRRSKRLAEMVISRAWPELLELPFQQLCGFRGLAVQLKRQSRQRFRRLASSARGVLRRVIRRRA